MAALVLRGIAARKLRAVLTATAVLLGVAMVSGTYVLTDTINSSFDAIFKQGTAGVDVEVTAHKTVSTERTEPPAFPESYAQRVRNLDGVDVAVGGIFDLVSILGKNGKPLAMHGAPNFVTSVVPPRVLGATYFKVWGLSATDVLVSSVSPR